jgi:predicted AlkP superfamily phosphohydrolase/phosphomutase
VRTELLSVIPPTTLPAWTSFMTGVNPGQHGVLDFTRREGYKLRFLGAWARKRETFFKRLSRAGKKVCVLFFPATYPPEAVNGIMISGFDTPVTCKSNRSFFYPPSLFYEVKEKFGDLWFDNINEFKRNPGWYKKAIKKLKDKIERKTELGLWLLNREKWDLFAIHFSEADTVCHHFWAICDPLSPRHEKGKYPNLRNAIKEIYQVLDEALGVIIKNASLESIFFIVSDHGMGGSNNWVWYLNRMLYEMGYLKFSKGLRFSPWIKRKGISLIPPKVREFVFRKSKGFIPAYIEAICRFGSIDFKQTLVFSEELNYFPALWINLHGRDPDGIVYPGKEYRNLKDKLSQDLKSICHPNTGERLILDVLPKEEVWKGPFMDNAPDLVLEVAFSPRGYSYNFLQSSLGEKNGSWLSPLPLWTEKGPKGGVMTGSHRKKGILIIAGKEVKKGYCKEKRIEDIAPTVCALAGVLPSLQYEGKIIDEAIWKKRQLSFIEPKQYPEDPDFLPYSKSEENRIARRLQKIGYF